MKIDGAFSIWSAIEANDTRPIVVMSKSGRAIFKLLSTGYTSDVFVISNNVKVKKMCQLFSNNIKTILTIIDATPTIEILWDNIEQNADTIFKSNSEVIAIYVSKYAKLASVNTLTMFSKSDFE